MIHKRIITLEGPESWIKTTLKNSLPDGVNTAYFGKGKSIKVETIEGDPVEGDPVSKKPESRYELISGRYRQSNI